MLKTIRTCRTLEGEVVPPGDKSISHRALILNAIARGKATIANLLPGEDCRSTIACLRALGVSIQELFETATPTFVVEGKGEYGLEEAEDILNAGNSGTTMRLLAGLLSAHPFLSIITGDSSLRSRPMGRIVEPLHMMGARIWGRGENTLPPLAIRGGSLKGIKYRLPVASAQVKSALLLAGLYAQGQTCIEEPSPSRDHTERMLRAMGANLEVNEREITIRPGSLSSIDVAVPGDISAASFWMVAAAIHPQAKLTITNVGVNPTRSGVIEILKAMGAKIALENQRWEGEEPVADLRVESSPLKGVEIRGALIPRSIDEIPVLAVAASVAKGRTVIRDASELRVKESDRIGTVAGELSHLGARIEKLPDGMVIEGVERLNGGPCQSHGDHRLAMALAVAGLVAQGETSIEDANVVEVSYPGFWKDLERLSSQEARK